MSIEENLVRQLKRGLAFICVEENSIYKEIGTGFFVNVVLEEYPAQMTGYFITAKHILQQNDVSLEKIYLRMNSKDGNVNYLPLEIKGKIIFHSDNAVDLAVMPCLPNREKYDYVFFPAKNIGSKDMIQKQNIMEGDESFFAGLFLPHRGYCKNIPIFRFGRIALLTEEKIFWNADYEKTPMLTELYLIDCHTFSGNSGSPTFFSVHPKLQDEEIPMGPPNIFFAGVISGSFTEENKVNDPGTIYPPSYSENQGITAVTPAYKLRDILFSEELIKQRKTLSDEIIKNEKIEN